MNGIWLDTFKNVIPVENYSVSLTSGEEAGLTITLIGSMHNVVIDFGITAAIQMLDEGVLLQGEDTPQLQNLRKDHFPSAIYEIKNGDFSRYIESCMGTDIYCAFQYRQYNIVTLNCVISVVTQWEPKITVTTT